MVMPVWQLPFVIFSFISVVLYIWIFIIIITKRRTLSYFRGSYFTLTIFQAVIEWIMFLEFLIFYKARKFGYLNFALKQPSDAWIYLPRFSTFFHYYLKIVIYFGQIFLAANRFTAIFRPMNYEKLWAPKRIWYLRIFQFSIPTFLTAPIAFNSRFDIHYEYIEEQIALRLTQDPVSAALVSYIDGGASFFATIICSVIYISIFLKTSADMLRYGIEKKVLVEIRLAFCALSIFIVLLLNNIVQLMTCYGAYFESKDINLIVNDLSYPVVDFLYSITPWALLFTSTEVQRQLLRPCHSKINQQQQTLLIRTSDPGRTVTVNVTSASNSIRRIE